VNASLRESNGSFRESNGSFRELNDRGGSAASTRAEAPESRDRAEGGS
jgi:hypothetical protein